MSVAYQPLTHPRVAEFARKFRFPSRMTERLRFRSMSPT